VSSALGFCLDVVVYHTFSLFVRSIMKLLVCVCSGKQPCRVRFLAVALAASGICGACTLHPPTHPRKHIAFDTLPDAQGAIRCTLYLVHTLQHRHIPYS
jgi:hypothetical protein